MIKISYVNLKSNEMKDYCLQERLLQKKSCKPFNHYKFRILISLWHASRCIKILVIGKDYPIYDMTVNALTLSSEISYKFSNLFRFKRNMTFYSDKHT